MSSNRLLFVGLAVALLGAGGCKSFDFRNFLNRGKTAAPPALTGFEAVQIGPGFNADIAVGGAFAVTVDGDKALTRQVLARVEKQTLIVTRAAPAGTDLAATPLALKVALPKLTRLQVDGARATVAGAAGPQLEIAAGAKATVNATAIDAAKVSLTGRDGSRIVLAGEAQSLDVSLSGGSRGDARQLALRTAKVDLVEASRLDLKPERAISGKAAGGSLLAVWNKPKRVGVATRGASDVSYVR